MNDFKDRADELIVAGKTLYAQGMVPATSGNFSARLNDGTLAITVSGRHKGQLSGDDIMRIDVQGKPIDPQRPSAETGLHTQIYARYPDVGCVLHPHPRSATVVSRRWGDFIRLSDYELLKVFPGIISHATSMYVPIFDNDQDIGRLAKQVGAYMGENSPLFGYIIRSHGLYTWGKTVADALRYVEAFDYLFSCELQLKEA
ncbi:MAG: methylthioribulose 1-phosphate dehydratase [Gammaproteobacteria bacterium]|nr:methylthioribulose 1-phosphate dehydratase [Gammaproteobacteria bacterium]